MCVDGISRWKEQEKTFQHKQTGSEKSQNEPTEKSRSGDQRKLLKQI